MKKITTFLTLLYSLSVTGQSINDNFKNFKYELAKTTETINIDGIQDEQIWREVASAKDFYRVLPIDSGFADSKTEVKMTFDDKNLYILMICYEELPKPYIIESMRRDWIFGQNDNFLIFIDPFDDKTNGFSFGANAAGAQWDGLQENGGTVNLNWDNAWYSETKTYDDKWITEMAIPFKILRYRTDIERWGINFSRLDVKRNEKSSWAPVPRQFPTASLAYTGSLIWKDPPPPMGNNITIIPYTMGIGVQDKINTGNSSLNADAGLDAKISLSSSVNLDLTLNPDFSQVEVDRQVVNLSRFEIFFPERRQFFLENSDLFSGYGHERLRPFFSRRIGLESPILAGARASGKINRNWRAGVLNMQTGRVDSTHNPSGNYTVATIQRQLFARSNLSAILVNKQNFNLTPEDIENGVSGYNRVMGLDYNIASRDEKWRGKVIYQKSFDEENPDDSYAHAVNLTYKSQIMTASWNHDLIGTNYNPEVGFAPRTGYFSIYPDFSYRFYPGGDVVNYHGPLLETNFIYNFDNVLTDKRIDVGYQLLLLNTSLFTTKVSQNRILLDRDFDPTRMGGDSLRVGSLHNWIQYEVGFTSDKRRLFTFDGTVFTGGFFNGDMTGSSFNIRYRYQPYGSISLSGTYQDIRLPEPYNSAKIFVGGPKIDLTFSRNLFFTSFIQFNNQSNNFNINSRLQWRFKPVSDLFIVYSDNYYAETLKDKNRALVIKLNYWLNL